MNKRRFIAYYRVSTNGQSPESQIPIVQKYCLEKGIDLIVEYKAKESASGKKERIVFEHALKVLEEYKLDGLVVYDTDRFFRDSTLGFMCFEKAFKRTGKVLVSVAQDLDTSTDEGWYRFARSLVDAEYDNKKRKRITLRGKNELRPLGVHVNSTAPFGKQIGSIIVNKVKRSVLIDNPVESQWIEKAKDLRDNYGYTYDEIANVFTNHWQVPGKSGHKRKWDKSAIYRLLAGGIHS